MTYCVVFNFLIQQGDLEAFVLDYQYFIEQDVDNVGSFGEVSRSVEQTFSPANSALMSVKRNEIIEALRADWTN